MSHRVHEQAGRWTVVINAPESRCVPLSAGEDALAPELLAGTWLLLCFAVWSAPDRELVDQLLEDANALPEELFIGLRPYDDVSELSAWIDGGSASPHWLILRDGRLLDHRSGALGRAELERWLGATVPSTPLP